MKRPGLLLAVIIWITLLAPAVSHGAMDNIVPVGESERMVNALKNAGGEVRFTVYPFAGHDAWTETYNNPELYRWFLEHKK